MIRSIGACSKNIDEGGSAIGADDGRYEDATSAEGEDLVPLRLIKPHGCAEVVL